MSTNFTFGDDSPARFSGRRHRRGRGGSGGGGGAQNANNSYRRGRGHLSSAAARSGWDDQLSNTPSDSSRGSQGFQDDNDGTGSLSYSASSSVQSAESSANSSSFGDILKQIDSDMELKEYTDPEVHEFMKKQSRAAVKCESRVGNDQSGKMKGLGMDVVGAPDAVLAWNKRAEDRKQVHKKKQPNQTSGGQREQPDFNYFDDELSSDDDVYGVEITQHEENTLQTISG